MAVRGPLAASATSGSAADVVMPGPSGVELAARFAILRAGTAVLYMSGYTITSMEHQRGLEPGLSLLAKPITPDSLLRRVRQVIDGASAEQGSGLQHS